MSYNITGTFRIETFEKKGLEKSFNNSYLTSTNISDNEIAAIEFNLNFKNSGAISVTYMPYC